MKKEYTGVKDAYGRRIFDGSILVIDDSDIIYWKVFKSTTGLWLKKGIDARYNELNHIKPLRDEFARKVKVIEDISRYINGRIIEKEIDWCCDCVAGDFCECKCTECCYKGKFDINEIEEKRIEYAVGARKLANKAGMSQKDYAEIASRSRIPEFREKIRILQAMKYFEVYFTRPANITDKDIEVFKNMDVKGVTVGGNKTLSYMDQIVFMKALYPEKFK